MLALSRETAPAHSGGGKGRTHRYAGLLLALALLSTSLPANENAGASSALYTVKDGNKVDQKTLNGWKTWRALACERCHGAEQEGLVGAPLVETMKNMSKEDFHKTIMEGRIDKGMPPFNTSQMVTKNWEGLYAYLKGRSDGKIKPGKLTAIEQP